MAGPWVAWFGYRIWDVVQRHPGGPVWRSISASVWLLLLVPVGFPVLYRVWIWVLASLRPRKASSRPRLSSPHPAVDFHSALTRAITASANNTHETREFIYDHARTELASRLHGRDPAYVASERFALEAAILRVEAEAPSGAPPTPEVKAPDAQQIRDYERLTRKNPSTTLLLASMFILHKIWALDCTSMSLYWVARLPKAIKK